MKKKATVARLPLRFEDMIRMRIWRKSSSIQGFRMEFNIVRQKIREMV